MIVSDELLAELQARPPEELSGLPDEFLQEILRETEQYDAMQESLTKGEWCLPPADPLEFLTSGRYLGYAIKQVPVQEELLTKLFYSEVEPQFYEQLLGNRCRLVLLDGAVGTGKSFSAGVVLAYLVHRMLASPSPQAWWGLTPGSRLTLTVQGADKENVSLETFDEVQRHIRGCPWFRVHGFIDDGKVRALNWPKQLLSIVIRAASVGAIGGLTTPVAVFDEAALAKEMGQTRRVDQTAQGVFDRLHHSMESRFQDRWMLIVIANARHEKDFMAQLRDRFAGKDWCLYRHYKSWQGLPSSRPPEGWDADELKDKTWFLNPLTLSRVPLWLKDSCLSNVEGFSQDHEGYRQSRQSRFDTQFHEIEAWLQEAQAKRLSPIDETGNWVEDFAPGKGGIPDAPVWVHFDLSSTQDRLGVAGVQVSGWRTALGETATEQDTDEGEEQEPEYFLTFYDVVAPEQMGGEIRYGEVRTHYVYELDRRGFEIAGVSCDRHASEEFLQQLRDHGYRTRLISVDLNPGYQIRVRRALHARGATGAHSPRLLGLYSLIRSVAGFGDVDLFLHEWRGLVRKDTGTRVKIEKGQGATDDLVDAVAGAVEGANAETFGSVRVLGQPSGGAQEQSYAEAVKEYEAQWHRNRWRAARSR